MIDALIFISQREIVFVFALIGGVIATIGGYRDRARAQNKEERKRILTLTHLGYGITALSVLLFIVAGFVSDLRP